MGLAGEHQAGAVAHLPRLMQDRQRPPAERHAVIAFRLHPNTGNRVDFGGVSTLPVPAWVSPILSSPDPRTSLPSRESGSHNIPRYPTISRFKTFDRRQPEALALQRWCPQSPKYGRGTRNTCSAHRPAASLHRGRNPRRRSQRANAATPGSPSSPYRFETRPGARPRTSDSACQHEGDPPLQPISVRLNGYPNPFQWHFQPSRRRRRVDRRF